MTRDEAVATLEHLRDHGVGLTAWESEFCASVSEQLERSADRGVSAKQAAIIEKIAQERIP